MHSTGKAEQDLRAALHDIVVAIEHLDRVDDAVGVPNWIKIRGDLINSYLDVVAYASRPFDQFEELQQ